MPIGHGKCRLRALRAATFVVDCVAPFAIIYTAMTSSAGSFSSTTLLLLSIYFRIEAAFCILFIIDSVRLQQPHVASRMSATERRAFLNRITNEMHDVADFRQFLAGWFYWKDRGEKQLGLADFHLLRRDNVKEWMAWSLFSYPSYDELQRAENGAGLSKELNILLKDMEAAMKLQFPPGRNPHISPIKLNHNRVLAYPKPFIFYAVIFFSEICVQAIFRVLGFRVYKSTSIRGWRDTTSCWGGLQRAGGYSLTYWKRDPATENLGLNSMHPIVFAHGMGGLWCYIYFVFELMKANPSRTIFLVDIRYAGLRMVEYVPKIEDTVADISNMLKSHGFEKSYFIGHSFGTGVCAWMMKATDVVEGVALIDPITFLTYHASLAYNFVHRHPGRNSIYRANDLLIHWLVARELYVSRFISRHFCWHKNVIWPETLPEKHHIFISRNDSLIDGELVCKYIEKHGVKFSISDTDHAQFLYIPKLQRDMIKKITVLFNSQTSTIAQ